MKYAAGMTLRVAVVDGSLRPGEGNTARALAVVTRALSKDVTVDPLGLATYAGTVEELAARLRAANALLFGSGTYWNSWGSPLQRFLEVMTPYEATDVFAGKPASVVVTMDSTGGGEIAARLSATLVCLGCFAPPFSWMTLSRVGTALAKRDPGATRDVWGTDDLAVLAANLEEATRKQTSSRGSFRAWTIERTEAATGSYPHAGPLPPAA